MTRGERLRSLELDIIESIILAKQYHIDEWLVPSLNRLAQREEALSLEEAELLLPVAGLDFILKVARIRERLGNNSNLETPIRWCDCGDYGRGDFNFSDIIREVLRSS